jgi:hypothetical protein
VSLKSGGRFRVIAFGRNLASVAVKMFLLNVMYAVLSMQLSKIMLQKELCYYSTQNGSFPSTLIVNTTRLEH